MKKLMMFWLFPLLLIPTAAFGQAQVVGSPASWRLQNYNGNNVVMWFTGSSCGNGKLSTDHLTESDKSRFYATILAAKLSLKKVFVYYNVVGGNCQVASFGMDTP